MRGKVEHEFVLDAALIAATQAVDHYEITRNGTLISWANPLRHRDCVLSFCSGHIDTVTLRFSPRFGFSPVSCALTNSNAATALLDGPSHSSAVSG